LDTVHVVTTYPQTRVNMERDISFFGMVQWAQQERISDEL